MEEDATEFVISPKCADSDTIGMFKYFLSNVWDFFIIIFSARMVKKSNYGFLCIIDCGVGLGDLGVTCSPRDSRFAGSNPAEVDGLFQDLKT